MQDNGRRKGFLAYNIKILMVLVIVLMALAVSGIIFAFAWDFFAGGEGIKGEIRGNLMQFRNKLEHGCGVEGARQVQTVIQGFHSRIDRVYIFPSGGKEGGTRITAEVTGYSWNVSVPLTSCNRASICQSGQSAPDCSVDGELGPVPLACQAIVVYYTYFTQGGGGGSDPTQEYDYAMISGSGIVPKSPGGNIICKYF